MVSRSRIVSCVGLVLFAAAAVFWADFYTYMKPARDAGEPFGISDYVSSVTARVAGQPDAATLRRDRRRAEEKAAETSILAITSDKLNRRSVSDGPSFARIGTSDDDGKRKRGFLDKGGAEKSGAGSQSGGIKFIGTARAGGCTMSGSIKRCRVGG